MTALPALCFRPILRDYLWGGRRLGTELGKSIGNLDRCAESWEVVDHGADQSVVSEGRLGGETLHNIVTNYGRLLFDRHFPQRQFPLLLKFLDCRTTLSVQVHPNDEQGAKLYPPDLGKTEAWVVLAADPGSKIYAGLKAGIDREQLQRELVNGTCENCLHSFEPRVGDCVLIEAGTVHALGAGLLIAEIQQASDTTFRLYDWNRVDRDGKPRELHIELALNVIDFSRGPVLPVEPKQWEGPLIERLVKCDKFVLDRWTIESQEKLPNDDRFHILAVVEGNIELRDQDNSYKLRRGDSILVPASTRPLSMGPQGKVVLLDMYLP